MVTKYKQSDYSKAGLLPKEPNMILQPARRGLTSQGPGPQNKSERAGKAAGVKQKFKYQTSLQWQGRSNIKAGSLQARVSPGIIRQDHSNRQS